MRNVIPRMAIHPDIESILCATPPSIDIKNWFSFSPKVKFITCKPFKWMYYRPDDDLKKSLKEFSPDVIFIPVERYFKFNSVPIVNMIQNMEPFAENIDENYFINKCRLYIQRLVAKRAIKKADRVIAISRYVKEFLSYKWNIPEEKIGLVYHGIEIPRFKEFIRPNNIPKDREGNFLFTVGSIRPARGLEDVLWAMNHLKLEKVDIKELVIAGDVSPSMISYQHRLKKWIQAQNLSSKIYWVGSLNEKEMNWCYRNCKMFVMTSRVEFFGMIAGKAMAHGCVCISSDSPCLPEIFGDAAIYYPPKKHDVLAKRIEDILNYTNKKRQALKEKSLSRILQFSWDRCAENIILELRKAIKNNRKKYNKT